MSKKYHSSKLAHNNKIKRIWLSILFVIIFLLFFGGGYYLFNHPKLNISNFEVLENKYSDQEKINAEIQKILNQKLFYFIPKTNILFLPYSNLRQKISEIDLTVSNVEFDLTDWDILKVYIKEYNPVASYCQEKSCYFTNQNGLIFAKEPELVLEDLVKLEGLIDLEKDLIGQYYSDSETFGKILFLKNLLEKISIKVIKVSSQDNETFNLYTKDGPYLIFDRYDNPEEVANNLKVLIDKESLHDVQFSNVQYIDLRFDKKVYYKLN